VPGSFFPDFLSDVTSSVLRKVSFTSMDRNGTARLIGRVRNGVQSGTGRRDAARGTVHWSCTVGGGSAPGQLPAVCSPRLERDSGGASRTRDSGSGTGRQQSSRGHAWPFPKLESSELGPGRRQGPGPATPYIGFFRTRGLRSNPRGRATRARAVPAAPAPIGRGARWSGKVGKAILEEEGVEGEAGKEEGGLGVERTSRPFDPRPLLQTCSGGLPPALAKTGRAR
jgi:hypothetical protein